MLAADRRTHRRPAPFHCPQPIHKADGVIQGCPDPRCPFLILQAGVQFEGFGGFTGPEPAVSVEAVDAKGGVAVAGFTRALFTANEVEVDAQVNGVTAGTGPVNGDDPRQALSMPNPRLVVPGEVIGHEGIVDERLQLFGRHAGAFRFFRRMTKAVSMAPKKVAVRTARITSAGFVHAGTNSYSALHLVVSGNSWSCSCAF
jgi:hypothetical protein